MREGGDGGRWFISGGPWMHHPRCLSSPLCVRTTPAPSFAALSCLCARGDDAALSRLGDDVALSRLHARGIGWRPLVGDVAVASDG